TGNMSGHAKKCWGEEAVTAVKDSTLDKACSAIKTFGKKSQTRLTAALKKFKGWAKTFSTCPPEKETTCHYSKEGHPKHYVLSKETIARDVKKLYTKTKEKLAEELQAIDGELPIAIDCWTSPNHHVFMSIIV
ncbi:hypothetical protein BT96DRAFT_739320, partial [Gymnopus androsaceus JB14]